MRRSFKTAIIILILLFAFSFAAYAGNTARADIPVKVEGGGTAVITSEVNCPAPNADRLELKKGETGHFIIDFSRPGEYAYNITVINSNDSFIYTPEYYSVHISVLVGDDGSMYTVTTLRKENSYAKSDIADFRRTEKTTGAPPTTLSTVTRMIWGITISASADSAAQHMQRMNKALLPFRNCQISFPRPLRGCV